MDNIINIVILFLIGILSGALVSIIGGGGYSILIPLIIFTGILEDYKLATGTTLMAISLPIALITAVKYYNSDLVHIQYALLLTLALFIGIYFGSKFAVKTKTKNIKQFIGIFLLVTGVLTLMEKE